MNSNGPGSENVYKCHTISLVDLADVDGFGDIGMSNVLYGFQLKNGVYKRREVLSGDLSRPDWLMDISIRPPYLMVGKNYSVRKFLNKGLLLASYVPSKKKSIIVGKDPNDENKYVLSSNRGNVRNVSLSMVSPFSHDLKVKPDSTLLIRVFLGEAPNDFVEILPGLKIKWPTSRNMSFCTILIMGDIQKCTFSDVELQIADNNIISFSRITLQNIHLSKLQYIDSILPNSYLEAVIPGVQDDDDDGDV